MSIEQTKIRKAIEKLNEVNELISSVDLKKYLNDSEIEDVIINQSNLNHTDRVLKALFLKIEK